MPATATTARTPPAGFQPGAQLARFMEIKPRSYDAEAHTVGLVMSSGARVPRFGMVEELAITPDAVDLSRVPFGQVRLLDSHNVGSIDAIIGTVIEAHIEAAHLVGTARFADTDRGRAVEARIAAGERIGVSVGYQVLRWSLTSIDNGVEVWRADKWSLMEASLVAVPADPSGAVRAAPDNINLEQRTMPETIAAAAPAAQPQTTITAAAPPPAPAPAPGGPTIRMSAADQAAAYRSAEGLNLPAGFVTRAIDAGNTLDQFRDAALHHLAERSQQTRQRPYIAIGGDGGETLDNPEFLGRAISDALYARMRGKPGEGPAADFRGLTVTEMMREMGRRQNVRGIDRMDRGAVVDWAMATRAGGAHTTSDFPNLLISSGNRVLVDAYHAAETPLKQLARPRDAVDFRTLTAIKLGEAPKLLEVQESGEVGYGTRAEEKEAFRVRTFARIFSLSRQAIVNDDLGAFADTNTAWGRAAAETEASEMVALFLANTGDGADMDDGDPLYTTDRGNKAASGTVIDETNLGLARKALRDMKGLDGTTPIGVTPRHLVVGSAKETEAEKMLAAITPAASGDVNPFAGKLNLLVEPRLTGNAWRLFADPADLAVLVIAYLNGNAGPELQEREGWTTLGMEFRAVLDFGCGLNDWRGTYLNPGN